MSQSLHYRRAEVRDVFSLMRLYQLSLQDYRQDPLFLDHRRLGEAVASGNELWLVAEKGGEAVAVASLLREVENRLYKIARMYVDPSVTGSEEVQKELLLLLLENTAMAADVLYTTTRCLTYRQLELTEQLGFTVLGFFPLAMSPAQSDLNGVTAFFFDGVLEHQRYDAFRLHPRLQPFYEILRRQRALPPLPSADVPAFSGEEAEPLLELELIAAPRFVAQKFRRLRERKLLSDNFYPFQDPNILITDPEETIEIFAGLYPTQRFAPIIEERLAVAVNPTTLYNRVSLMLRGENISYIELIVDAADVAGIECLLQAGFLPCAYFPALKRIGETRRDYVVLGRAFEKMIFRREGVNPRYMEFVDEYFRLEKELAAERR